MNHNYETISLELHLFFGRIMKEHALFLMAGFPSKNTAYIKEADWYRTQFEELLRETVMLADCSVSSGLLRSDEIVTEYTMGAEKRTSFLTGISIDSRITAAEKNLRAMGQCEFSSHKIPRKRIRELNQRALRLTSGLISFKEKILKDMSGCRLFTFNYPLLVEHIQREAKLYRELTAEIEREGMLSDHNIRKAELFWNQIMMEHALFIRGLLDPTEETLIQTADEFAEEYKSLLNEAKKRDLQTCEELTRKTIQETERYRDFKAAGTKGIIDCRIAGLILPLLADHVLREANHYLRILESGHCEKEDHSRNQNQDCRCVRRNLR